MKDKLASNYEIVIESALIFLTLFALNGCSNSAGTSSSYSSKVESFNAQPMKDISIKPQQDYKNDKFNNLSIIRLKDLKQKYGENYLYYNFDINADGLKDLIITVDSQKADKVKDELDTLYIYTAQNANNFRLSLKSTNFASDGGNSFLRVSPRINHNGFIISTYFPDRGTFFQDYYIKPNKNNDTKWLIEKEIGKGEFMNYEGNISYYCNYPQNNVIFNNDFNIENDQISDEEKRVKCPSPPTQYVVSAQKANILNDNFENTNPPNYFIKGDKVEAVEQNDDWIRIMYKNDKKTGWLSKADLSPLNKP